MALLVYAPIAFGLALVGAPALAIVGAAISVVFARLPDLDQQLPVTHRGPTHTVWFAVVTGLTVGGGWIALFGWLRTNVVLRAGPIALSPLSGVVSAVFLGGVATLSVLSHLLADGITPVGVRPLTPFSDTHYTWTVTTSKNRMANVVLLILGVGSVSGAIYGGTVLAA